ncbi:MAG: MotA/TolQ/ExbB proton channel family protein [Gammaproteobacteria bacterium]
MFFSYLETPLKLQLPLLGLLLSLSMAGVVSAQAEETLAEGEEAGTLEQLLELVRQGKIREDREASRREETFTRQVSRQKARVDSLKNRLNELREDSTRLENKRNENNLEIARLREQKERSEGSLKEVFGNLQASASAAAELMQTSLVTAQLGTGRIAYLRDLALRMENTDRLPDISEIEELWAKLQEELYEAGRVVSFQTEVVGLDGVARPCDAHRISVYNIVCDGNYVVLQRAGHLSELKAQPASRFHASASNLGSKEYVPFGIDPTGPQGNTLLKNLISSPTLGERIEHGGIIGRLILMLGSIGILLALAKFAEMTYISIQLRGQLRREEVSESNPLGRVLKVYDEHKNASLDALEAHLAQAIGRERPRIERFVPFLKIIATVAPLMGLLGTVTGMIITFQQITIYGTGDPKTMAGGISVALVTTVLGLVVAIPMVLAHAIVASRVKSVLTILEERSIGLVARKAEAEASA